MSCASVLFHVIFGASGKENILLELLQMSLPNILFAENAGMKRHMFTTCLRGVGDYPWGLASLESHMQ